MKPDDYPKFWPKHLAKTLTTPKTSLWYNLEVAATRYPDKPITIFYDSQLSYAEFKRQAERLAGFMQKNWGVARGDRVLLDLQNSPQFILSFYAILRCDAVVVPVSPMNVTDELAHYCADSGARFAIFGQELAHHFQPLLGSALTHAMVCAYSDYLTEPTTLKVPEMIGAAPIRIDDARMTKWSGAVNANVQPEATLAGADDLCAILYTSGTTGRPKGCMHSHSTFNFNAVGAAIWEAMRAESVVLATAPLFHVTGMEHSMHAPIYAGASIALLPRWDAEAAGRMIERLHCTHWANVPTMVVDLLAHPATAQRNLASLENIFGGGASMPEPVARKLYELCGIEYMEAYGMTETISQTHMNPPGNLRKQCLGIPTFDTESLVVDPDTLTPLGPNQQGEIVSSGPQLMHGYWNNAEATQATLVDIGGKRFLRTGDLGFYDDDGFFYIADRLKRMINASGYKVWPAEVEMTLYQHPDVKEAAVVSAPDPRRGETVKAFVVLKSESKGKIAAEQLIEWAREHMAAYKVPRLVEFVDALPRSGTGKIQWRLLQEQEWTNK